MRKYRIREKKTYEVSSDMTFSNFYPEYVRKLFWFIPIWLNVTDNPYSCSENLEWAKQIIQEDINYKLATKNKPKDVIHPVCIEEKTNKVIDCDTYKN